MPPSGWTVRQAARGAGDPFVARLLAGPRLALERTFDALPSRGAPPGTLALDAGDAPRAVILRHASGALTLHGPGAEPGGFRLALRGTGAVRAFVVRVRDRGTERALGALARRWEEARFSRAQRPEGFVLAGPRALAKGALPAFDARTLPPAPARSLLLLHGTASDAAGAFGALATTRGADGATLLERLAPRYEGRVVAFNHPTVSRTPEENAAALLAALPPHPVVFDVISHSRGGVLLRTLAEAAPHAGRFRLGHAVLVAAPNEGSALAAPERWGTWVSWLANLLDLFPGSFANGMSLVAESLVWLARRTEGALPGVAALAPGSATLAALRGDAGRYAAIGASAAPGGLLARMADAGVGPFFGEAHDLVVPARGAFPRGLAAERAACFGRGGNLGAAGVHHVNFFAQPETVDLLGDFLETGRWSAPPLDPRAPLPFGPVYRGAPGAGPRAAGPRAPGRVPRPAAFEPFDLALLADGGAAQVLASWRGARVVAPLAVRGGAAGERMRRIIAFQERTLASFSGRAPAPTEPETRDAGALLFETLFPGDVLRLWDRARGEAPLVDLRITSALEWIAEKPWELAYDPSRAGFLALDGVRVSRASFGLLPAAAGNRRRGPLRVLVVASQPAGLSPLSLAGEEAALRRAFAPLVASGRAALTVVRRATPARLHERIAHDRPDVVHVIGHGEWDAKTGCGALFLEDGRGASHALDAPALRALLTARGLSLVVLNACESGRGGRRGLARGLAQALAAGGVPAVVANQYPVLDASAALLARVLAEALAAGASVGEAVREARLALATHPQSALDWAVPVLFAHDARRALFAPPAR